MVTAFVKQIPMLLWKWENRFSKIDKEKKSTDKGIHEIFFEYYFSNNLVEDAFLKYVILFCKHYEVQESQISETSGSLATCRKIIFTKDLRHSSCDIFLVY